MPNNVTEFGFWFLTAFVGALIVKLIDLVINKYADRKNRNKERAEKLLDHVKHYGELIQLFRFYAHYESKIVQDENGQLKRDEHGNFMMDTRILEPEPRFEEALKALHGTDINSLIAQKIATIRLATAEMNDIAYELDPSSKLKEGILKLYTATIWSIELILKDREPGNIGAKFNEMVVALLKADESRLELRMQIQKFAQ